MDSRSLLLDLKEVLTAETLLNEIVRSMSTDEARETYAFICRMHDLNGDENNDE